MTPDLDPTRTQSPSADAGNPTGTFAGGTPAPDPTDEAGTGTREALAALDALRRHGEPSPAATAPVADNSGPVELPPGFVYERALGKGGMGAVYLARQVGLNRPVAVKMVLAAANPTAVIRFLAEAEAVAAVKHPNAVEVYQFGDHRGQPFLVLEYCAGGDLTVKTKAGRLAPREAAELLAAVAEGVNAAHAAGIVHRDLKPQNVLLAADGTPKVADFGLAKRGLGADLTHSGAIMGTPAYMSPEQAGGGTKFVGPESDVWALGVILYELLAGKRPFAGPSNADYFAQILNGRFDPLRSACPEVPRDLDLIMRKCLRSDPRERYANAGELAADLRNWLAGKPISARPMGSIEAAWKWSRRNPAVAASLTFAFLALTAGLVVSLWQAGEARYQEKQARYQEKQAETRAGQLSVALDEKTKAEESLKGELKESRRRHDLSRLREAEADFERNAVQAAVDKLDQIDPENRCIVWRMLREKIHGADLVLRGHTGNVTSVAFSPDGRRVVTGSADTTARVWDAVTGQSVIELKGHTAFVSSVAFSPDGRRVVTGSRDRTARVWDAGTGTSLLELKGHTTEVMSVAFSSDGLRIATGAENGSPRLWDASTGTSLLELREPSIVVSNVAFSPDGRRIVTGSGDRLARVWDAATGQCVLELRGHTDSVTSVAYSPDGRRVVTGSEFGTTRVWDAANGQSLLELKGNVSSLAFSPDGRRIVTGTADGTTRACDATTGQCLLELKGHTGRVAGVAFSPDGRRVVTCSWDGTARVWDAATGQSVFFFQLVWGANETMSAALSPDGRRIAIMIPGGNARVWDAVTSQPLLELSGSNSSSTAMTLSPDGRRLVTCLMDGTARVWDAATGKSLFKLKGHASRVTSAAFDPDGQRIATGSRDGTARVWDAATGKNVLELKGGASSVTGVSFSLDGRRVVTGSQEGTVRVWDAATGKSLLELKVNSFVTGVAFSPDGRRIATGSRDKTARVWDAATGQSLLELKGHLSWVAGVSFDPDGRRVVTGSRDGTARVWDAATGQSLLELKGHTGEVTSVAFGSGGRQIVTCSMDRTVRIWGTRFDPNTTKSADALPLTADELAHRRWLVRPDPERHAKFAEDNKTDPFARAVQLSLEQQARGQLAVESLEFRAAQAHFLNAVLLKPTPHQWLELAPPPRSIE